MYLFGKNLNCGRFFVLQLDLSSIIRVIYCTLIFWVLSHNSIALDQSQRYCTSPAGPCFASASAAKSSLVQLKKDQLAPTPPPCVKTVQSCSVVPDNPGVSLVQRVNCEILNGEGCDIDPNYTWTHTETAGFIFVFEIPPAPRYDAGEDCPSNNNPISFRGGNKYFEFNDFTGRGVFPLTYTRYYNSQYINTNPNSPVGSETYMPKWTHTYDRRLTLGETDNNQDITSVVVWRHTGKSFVFEWNANIGEWESFFDKKSVLRNEKDANGDITKWEYITSDQIVEEYDPNGRLQLLTHPSGMQHDLDYELIVPPAQGEEPDPFEGPIFDEDYKRITVTDSRGKSIIIDIKDGVFSKLIDPDQYVTEYIFDRENRRADRLVEVIYPDTTPSPDDNNKHIFFYEDTNSDTVISRIEDEDGKVLSKVTYDGFKRALTSELANGAEKINVVYGHDNTHGTDFTQVTNVLGKITKYHFENINTAPSNRYVFAEGVATQNCIASSQHVVYQSTNDRQVIARTDWAGNITYYERDDLGRVTREEKGHKWKNGVSQWGYLQNDNNQLKTQYFEGEANLPSPLVVTETFWHPQFNEKIECTVEQNRVTKYTYSNEGLLLTKKVEPRTTGNENCN